MDELDSRFLSLGLAVPRVLLPSASVDPRLWAVIACDQFTSEPEYWRGVEDQVGDAPSTLSLILPELYLGTPDEGRRVARILAQMKRCLAEGILREEGPLLVLVERSTPFAAVRRGIVAAVDLERYDFRPGSQSLIRATEGTILERLPPRVAIRREATLELPHVMVLYDDPTQSVLEPLLAAKSSLERLYDFDLMTDAGHITGYRVQERRMLEGVATAFERLADPDAFRSRYGSPDPLLFAVGDGNHSLAAAKELWEETKRSSGEPLDALHPARFALVELVNLHDSGLGFEPIHRILYGDGEGLLHMAAEEARVLPTPTEEAMLTEIGSGTGEVRVGFLRPGGFGVLSWESAKGRLPAAVVQELLDRFLVRRPKARIDYIHGEETLKRLSQRPDSLGLLLPRIEKASFFETIVRDGVFPRKTFSMGEALEKRFYLEARRIRS